MDVKRQIAAESSIAFLLIVGLVTSFCTTNNTYGQFAGGQFQPSQTANWKQVESTGWGKSDYKSRSQNQTTFSGSQTAKIQWIKGENIDEAFRLAAQQNKPVMLHFWNERCQPCMSLEQFVFPNPILAEAINSQFIPVKVNTLKTPALHKKYGVTRLPWDVFVAPSGAKLRDKGCERNASQYTQVINSVAKIYKGLLNVAGAPTPSQSPGQPNRNTPNMQVSTQPPQTGGRVGGTPPMGQQQSVSGSRDVAFKSKPTPSRIQNQFFAQQQKARLENLPPVGMEGFCPVSMLRDTKKIAGSKDWGCIHRGKLYFFANQVYRDIFIKDPDRFAPVLAGFDIVVYRETGELVEGKTEFGGFVGKPENRVVFLFSSAENKKKFIDKQGRYLETARIATRNSKENWLR